MPPNRVVNHHEPEEDPQPPQVELKDSDPVAYIRLLINKAGKEENIIPQLNILTEMFHYILRKQEYILQRLTVKQYTNFAAATCDRCEVFLAHPTTDNNISFQNLLQQVIAAYSEYR